MDTRTIKFVLSDESDRSFQEALERRDEVFGDWAVVDVRRETDTADNGVEVAVGVIVVQG